jgi:RimJ/RimL family protein N-acetyltransferase
MTFIHAHHDKGLSGAVSLGRVADVRFPQDVPVLSDGCVTLRAHTPADASGSYEQCQDPLSRQWTTVPVPYSRADAEEYVARIVADNWRDGSDWSFAVDAPDDEGVVRYAGTVSLRDQGQRRAEIAYGSHPWVRGRGLMERALRVLVEWGFASQGVETMIWWANRGNWASRKLAWRLGFSYDGMVRQWLPQRGALLDAWVGALLRGDERAPRHPWYDVPRIAADGVVLREHDEKDVGRIVEACRDERTAYWLGGVPQPYTRRHGEEFLESRVEARATGRGLHWAVADPGTDELLANISLFDIKPGREAEIGYWTHPAARGRGVMTEACGLVLRHAFVPEEDGGQGLRRVMVYAAEGNSASRRVIEANGFTEVGRERRGIELRDGSLVDSICYDMLVEDFRLR